MAAKASKQVDLKFFADFTKTSLVNRSGIVPTDRVDIDRQERSEETAKAVWVPNRNGIFLSVAAGFAEGLGRSFIVPGFNLEETATFPDNSAEYCQSVEASLKFSTANGVRVKCFSIALTKKEMVAELNSHQDLLKKSWPCYMDTPSWCGVCESCQRFSRALEVNGLSFDKMRAEYENKVD